MHLNSREVLKILYVLWVSTAVVLATQSDPSDKVDYSNLDFDNFIGKTKLIDIMVRDVCIIGGGSSGTYTAIGLRDRGKSVVVVEEKDRLGGHTETYTDPVTQETIDIGVVVWHNADIVKNYLNRLGVAWMRSVSVPVSQTYYVDFRTGKTVPEYAPPTSAEQNQAFQIYAQQLAKYPFLDSGFTLPDPVPEELLLPFGEFVKKYNIGAIMPRIIGLGQGLGDVLTQTTLYVMKLIGPSLIQTLQLGYLTTVDNNNSEVYLNAQAVLGNDALLSSRVLVMNRNFHGGAIILVQTPSGLKIIKAKKVIVTIPPKLDNLGGFDLDLTERSLFSQFKNNYYYTGVLRNTGIPDTTAVANVGADTLYNVPVLPGIYRISPTGVPGLQNVKYCSTTRLTSQQVQKNIKDSVKRLKKAGTIDTNVPEFAVFAAHDPFLLTVSPSAIKAGFYRRLNSLQGYKNTFYTGAAFQTHDSTLIWRFTEALFPSILEALE